MHSIGDRTLVVHDPQLIARVFAHSPEALTPDQPRLTSRTSTSESDHAWLTTRRTGWGGMNRDHARVASEPAVASLIDALTQTDGAAVAVLDVVTQWACQSAVEFCLGPAAVTDGTPRIVAQRTVIADKLAASGLTYPTWWPSPQVRAMVRAGRQLNEHVDRHIRHRRVRRNPSATDLLDHILAEAPHLTDEQIRRLIKANLLAANSTPGAALAWVVWELCRAAELQERLSAEFIAAPARPTAADLPLADAVVREALRLHPPEWLLSRVATRDLRIGDVAVPQGRQVVFSPYLVQRDPRWWSRPEEFVPDRWGRGGASPGRGTWFPFGGGARVCLGIQLALEQLTRATAELAATFRIEAVTEPAAHPLPHPHLVPDTLVARFVTPRRP